MSTDIKLSFILERTKSSMNPTKSFYNEDSKKWEDKPTGEVLPKFQLLSSGDGNFLKELDMVMDFQGSYDSVDKKLWDILGITEELKDKDNSDFCCIAPRHEIYYENLLTEETKIKDRLKEYQNNYNMYSDLLAKSTNREAYELNQENMLSEQESISYLNDKLDCLKELKILWDYMKEESRVSFVYNSKTKKYDTDKVRVILTYYY